MVKYVAKKKPMRLRAGWRHDWYEPVPDDHIVIREIVPGPFNSPQLVESSPFVLLSSDHRQLRRPSQLRLPAELRAGRRCANLRTGIPDPWTDYLAFRGVPLIRSKVNSHDVELWSRQLDLTERAWKHFGVCMHQGIPDPWKSWPKAKTWKVADSKNQNTVKTKEPESIDFDGLNIKKDQVVSNFDLSVRKEVTAHVGPCCACKQQDIKPTNVDTKLITTKDTFSNNVPNIMVCQCPETELKKEELLEAKKAYPDPATYTAQREEKPVPNMATPCEPTEAVRVCEKKQRVEVRILCHPRTSICLCKDIMAKKALMQGRITDAPSLKEPAFVVNPIPTQCKNIKAEPEESQHCSNAPFQGPAAKSENIEESKPKSLPKRIISDHNACDCAEQKSETKVIYRCTPKKIEIEPECNCNSVPRHLSTHNVCKIKMDEAEKSTNKKKMCQMGMTNPMACSCPCQSIDSPATHNKSTKKKRTDKCICAGKSSFLQAALKPSRSDESDHLAYYALSYVVNQKQPKEPNFKSNQPNKKENNQNEYSNRRSSFGSERKYRGNDHEADKTRTTQRKDEDKNIHFFRVTSQKSHERRNIIYDENFHMKNQYQVYNMSSGNRGGVNTMQEKAGNLKESWSNEKKSSLLGIPVSTKNHTEKCHNYNESKKNVSDKNVFSKSDQVTCRLSSKKRNGHTKENTFSEQHRHRVLNSTGRFHHHETCPMSNNKRNRSSEEKISLKYHMETCNINMPNKKINGAPDGVQAFTKSNQATCPISNNEINLGSNEGNAYSTDFTKEKITMSKENVHTINMQDNCPILNVKTESYDDKTNNTKNPDTCQIVEPVQVRNRRRNSIPMEKWINYISKSKRMQQMHRCAYLPDQNICSSTSRRTSENLLIINQGQSYEHIVYQEKAVDPVVSSAERPAAQLLESLQLPGQQDAHEVAEETRVGDVRLTSTANQNVFGIKAPDAGIAHDVQMEIPDMPDVAGLSSRNHMSTKRDSLRSSNTQLKTPYKQASMTRHGPTDQYKHIEEYPFSNYKEPCEVSESNWIKGRGMNENVSKDYLNNAYRSINALTTADTDGKVKLKKFQSRRSNQAKPKHRKASVQEQNKHISIANDMSLAATQVKRTTEDLLSSSMPRIPRSVKLDDDANGERFAEKRTRDLNLTRNANQQATALSILYKTPRVHTSSQSNTSKHQISHKELNILESHSSRHKQIDKEMHKPRINISVSNELGNHGQQNMTSKKSLKKFKHRRTVSKLCSEEKHVTPSKPNCLVRLSSSTSSTASENNIAFEYKPSLTHLKRSKRTRKIDPSGILKNVLVPQTASPCGSLTHNHKSSQLLKSEALDDDANLISEPTTNVQKYVHEEIVSRDKYKQTFLKQKSAKISSAKQQEPNSGPQRPVIPESEYRRMKNEDTTRSRYPEESIHPKINYRKKQIPGDVFKISDPIENVKERQEKWNESSESASPKVMTRNMTQSNYHMKETQGYKKERDSRVTVSNVDLGSPKRDGRKESSNDPHMFRGSDMEKSWKMLPHDKVKVESADSEQNDKGQNGNKVSSKSTEKFKYLDETSTQRGWIDMVSSKIVSKSQFLNEYPIRYHGSDMERGWKKLLSSDRETRGDNVNLENMDKKQNGSTRSKYLNSERNWKQQPSFRTPSMVKPAEGDGKLERISLTRSETNPSSDIVSDHEKDRQTQLIHLTEISNHHQDIIMTEVPAQSKQSLKSTVISKYSTQEEQVMLDLLSTNISNLKLSIVEATSAVTDRKEVTKTKCFTVTKDSSSDSSSRRNQMEKLRKFTMKQPMIQKASLKCVTPNGSNTNVTEYSIKAVEMDEHESVQILSSRSSEVQKVLIKGKYPIISMRSDQKNKSIESLTNDITRTKPVSLEYMDQRISLETDEQNTTSVTLLKNSGAEVRPVSHPSQDQIEKSGDSSGSEYEALESSRSYYWEEDQSKDALFYADDEAIVLSGSNSQMSTFTVISKISSHHKTTLESPSKSSIIFTDPLQLYSETDDLDHGATEVTYEPGTSACLENKQNPVFEDMVKFQVKPSSTDGTHSWEVKGRCLSPVYEADELDDVDKVPASSQSWVRKNTNINSNYEKTIIQGTQNVALDTRAWKVEDGLHGRHSVEEKICGDSITPSKATLPDSPRRSHDVRESRSSATKVDVSNVDRYVLESDCFSEPSSIPSSRSSSEICMDLETDASESIRTESQTLSQSSL